MNYAFIRDGICINAVVFDEEPTKEIRELFVPNNCDDIVQLPHDFGIGSYYINGEWSKKGERSSSELRAEAYANDPIIDWNNELITVDQANTLFYNYFAEGNIKSDELQVLIAQAKESIRLKYPDIN